MAINTSEVCCSFDPQIKTSLLLTYLRNVNHTSRHQVAVSQHDTNEFNHSVALLCNPDGNSPCNVTSELETPAYLYVYVSTLFGAIFVAGVLGNLLVIQAVVRLRSMRTRMNYFLVSLSLADLLVLLICKPTAIIELFSKDVWLIGEAMCKIVPFLENVAHHSSVLSLLAISVERYTAICHPFRQQRRGRAITDFAAIVMSWLLSLVLSVPYVLMTHLEDAEYYDLTIVKVCRTKTREPMMQTFIILDFALGMMLPLLVLTILYTVIIVRVSPMCCKERKDKIVHQLSGQSFSTSILQKRNQVVFMMVSVVAIFFVCVLPMRFVMLWLVFSSVQSIESIGFQAYLNILYCARILIYTNSAANPIIYGLMSTKFRKAYRAILPGCRKRSQHKRQSTFLTSTL